MTTHEKTPEALRLASWLDHTRGDVWPSYVPQEAAVELRRLHAENETLRAAERAVPAGRSDAEIVEQTEELARFLLSWGFSHEPAVEAPTMRDSTHPFAERAWSAACHIQEMLTQTDVENALAELDGAPEAELAAVPAQQEMTAPAGKTVPLVGPLANLPTHVQECVIAYGDARSALAAAPQPLTPIDMVLHCPKCGLQHIDEPETLPMAYAIGAANFSEGHKSWDNPPHRSHLCHRCKHVWRPADVPTNGVQAVKTTGKSDSPVAAQIAPAPGAPPEGFVKVEAYDRLHAHAESLACRLLASDDAQPPEPTADALNLSCKSEQKRLATMWGFVPVGIAEDALTKALGLYMSAFGQALEAHGIAYGPQQIEADTLARAAIAAQKGASNA